MSNFRESLWVVVTLILCVFASSLFYSQFSLNHDTSWYLVATQMFMDGATLYQDIVEINPPLAFYLTIPALQLASVTHLQQPTALFIYVSALGGLSALWTYSIARRADLDLAARLVVLAAAVAGNFLIAIHEFGQREHLLLVLAMPYLFFLILRENLKSVVAPEAAGLGVLAFFGLALKPYFLLIPAGIVLARFARTRDFREFINFANVTLGLMLVGYLVFIALVHPLYLEEIVPTASLIYSAYGASSQEVLLKYETFALASVLLLAFRCRAGLDLTTGAILAALGGALTTYLIQFKGWNYQLIPTSFFIFFTAAWVTLRSRERVRENVLLGILALSAIGLSIGTQLANGPYSSHFTKEFGRFVQRPGEHVLVLSSNVSASFPFVNEVDAQWSSRYPAQWLVPGAITQLANTNCRQDTSLCDRYRAILSDTRSGMVADFVKNRPNLVFVDDRDQKSYFGDTRFDYIPFLLQDPDFAEFWQDYHQLDHVAGYQLWARKDQMAILRR